MCDCDPYNAQTCFKQINVIQNEYNSHKLYIMLWGQKGCCVISFCYSIDLSKIVCHQKTEGSFTLKNLNAKPNHNYKRSKLFQLHFSSTMNENKTKVTAVLIVVTLLLYSDLRGKVHHSGWCAYVLLWAW